MDLTVIGLDYRRIREFAGTVFDNQSTLPALSVVQGKGKVNWRAPLFRMVINKGYPAVRKLDSIDTTVRVGKADRTGSCPTNATVLEIDSQIWPI